MSTVFIDCVFAQAARPVSLNTLLAQAAQPHGSVDGVERPKDAAGVCIPEGPWMQCVCCEARARLLQLGVTRSGEQ